MAPYVLTKGTPISVRNITSKFRKQQHQGLPWLPGLIAATEADLILLFFPLPSTQKWTVCLFPYLGGIIMLIFWGELQSYHLVWRGKDEAGVEQELFDIGRSEWINYSPHTISLVPWDICVMLFHLSPLHPSPRVLARWKVTGYPRNFGSLVLFKNPKETRLKF